MFSLSTKSVYGLVAVADLARRGTVTQLGDIAMEHGIPHRYLEQIMLKLKNAGLVQSFRGVNGGYALARPAAKIAVIEILTALDGPLEVIPGEARAGFMRFFFEEVHDSLKETLDVSLSELLDRQRAQSRVLDFEI